MSNQELSNSLDTLLNSYNTQAAYGEQASKREIVLDEYEKSVLLTQAQDIVLKSYFDKTLNQQGQGFDDSSRRQIDFSSLIKIAELTPVTENIATFDERGLVYQLPRKKDEHDADIEGTTDVLFILNEKLIQVFTDTSVTPNVVSKKKEFVVVPISYKEYDREMSKAYAQPLKKQAWRLFQNQKAGFDVSTELIPRFNVRQSTEENETVSFIYKIRYVKRPRPIVLEDFDGLDIDGISKETSCELNPILHMDILNKAVELAVATRGGTPTPSQQQQ